MCARVLVRDLILVLVLPCCHLKRFVKWVSCPPAGREGAKERLHTRECPGRKFSVKSLARNRIGARTVLQIVIKCHHRHAVKQCTALLRPRCSVEEGRYKTHIETHLHEDAFVKLR